MSASFGSSKTKQNQSSKSQPWSPTIPYLNDYLGQIGELSTQPMSEDQTAAMGELKNMYGEGNQFSGQLGQLANDFFTGPGNQSGMLSDAYGALQQQLSPYAEGKMLDFKQNPYVQDMLSQVGDSVQQRINAQFAGAGRDMSGMNQKAVGAGVTQAQLPILADLYAREQGNQMNAANALFAGAGQTAQGIQGLNAQELATRAGGVPMAEAATNAEMWGPQGIFNLEQTAQDAPFARLGALGSLLLPVAQLGQQTSGTGQSSTSGFNVGAKLLSDERMKEEMEEIGQLKDGTPIYRFKYKGEDTVRMGLKAQDLEDRAPEAVSEVDAPQAGTEDGRVKYVDMDLATRRAADMMRAGVGSPNAELSGVSYPPAMPRPMLEDEFPTQPMRRAA